MAMTWFHVLITMQYQIGQQSVICTRLTELYAAHDVCVRDLRSAPKQKDQWYMYNDTCLVWHTGTTFIGWDIKPDRILRYEGTYNSKDNTWHTYKKSIVTEHIDKSHFSISSNEEVIHAIIITMDIGGCSIERKVYLYA
jgi:hypothetical protein